MKNGLGHQRIALEGAFICIIKNRKIRNTFFKINSYTAGQLTVSVGTVSLNTIEADQQDIKVKNISINDGFSPSPLVNDLALLQVSFK